MHATWRNEKSGLGIERICSRRTLPGLTVGSWTSPLSFPWPPFFFFVRWEERWSQRNVWVQIYLVFFKLLLLFTIQQEELYRNSYRICKSLKKMKITGSPLEIFRNFTWPQKSIKTTLSSPKDMAPVQLPWWWVHEASPAPIEILLFPPKCLVVVWPMCVWDPALDDLLL